MSADLFLTYREVEDGTLDTWEEDLRFGYAPRKTRMLALIDLVRRLAAENQQFMDRIVELNRLTSGLTK